MKFLFEPFPSLNSFPSDPSDLPHYSAHLFFQHERFIFHTHNKQNFVCKCNQILCRNFQVIGIFWFSSCSSYCKWKYII